MTARPGHLFIVGAPRCGTTAMFALLAQHPDVCRSEPKEPHYFCTDFHEESDRHHGGRLRFPTRTASQYAALFRNPSKAVMLEGTTAYLQSRVAAANIHAFDPGARIVAMVRDPVDLLHSLHAKMVSIGLEDERDFGTALALEPERRAGRRMPPGLFWPSSLYYSERVRLAEQIERYRAIFPADRVKVVVYDDFRRSNLEVYADVAAFAGLNAAFQPEARRVNVNRGQRFPAFARAAARLADSAVGRAVPVALKARMGRALRIANRRAQPRVPLAPDVRRALMTRFRPEVERLGDVLGRDLVSLWGYKS